MPLNSIDSHTIRATRKFVLAALASAAMLGAAASDPTLAGTYNYVFTPGGSTNTWTNTSAWTLTSGTADTLNYPGGDANVDDAAIVYTGNPAGGGAGAVGTNTITLSAPLNNALGNLTVSLTDSTASDALNLNVNANLMVNGFMTITGGAGTGSLKQGKTTVTTGASSNLSVAGNLTLTSANGPGPGSANLILNGNATLGGLSIKNDGSNITIGANAVNMSLGNVNLSRSGANGTAASTGLHILGGNVTALTYLIGTGDSGAESQVAGGNLTISGSFNVGNNGIGAATRFSNMFQSAGNVTAANSVLGLGVSTVATDGSYNLSGGNLTVAGIQLTNASGNTTSIAKFALSGGANAMIGASGIAVGNGTYTFTSTGGTIGASASWSSPANMVLTSGTTTFQAADSSGNPTNIALSGACPAPALSPKPASERLP